jgi:hypothetical protein
LRKTAPAVLLTLCALCGTAAPMPGRAGAAPAEPAASEPGTATFRAWIADMKEAPRGPFDGIRWFCEDGAVLPPAPAACKAHGGGHQHGQWSARTLALREAGYQVATLLADLDVEGLLASDPARTRFAQILVERYLVATDDGWILRRARYYRGAFQEEDERRGARELLLRLVADPEWSGFRYLALRTAVAMLPHGPESASAKSVRQRSVALSERDPGFMPLRNKIHGRLETGDAAAVEAYAQGIADVAQRAEYLALAQDIRALHASDAGAALAGLLPRVAAHPGLAGPVARLERDWRAGRDDESRLVAGATALRVLRELMTTAVGPAQRLALLDASIAVESSVFALAAAGRDDAARGTRRARLARLASGLDALYGTGLLTLRQYRAMHDELARLQSGSPSRADYRQVLDYLALAPNWANRSLEQQFGAAMRGLAELEPKASLFIQDQLRGSPLLAHAALVDGLLRDANRLLGVEHRIFDAEIGAGLRALNPGFARGVLRFARAGEVAELRRDEICVLPETVSELPPVAGIVTAGEGNPLSHVQLLARNLGIPNVAVDAPLLARLRAHAGERIVLAVSPGGAVRVLPADAAGVPSSDEVVAATPSRASIEVDLDRLALDARALIDLRDLRARDSGRTVGPKAAKLGELKAHYPDAVADGIAIPFGAFRALLDQPMPGEDGSVFDWMRREYARLDGLPVGSATRRRDTEIFRARLADWIVHADPGEEFRGALVGALRRVFGPDGSYGLFVRSDTNVEDLPGFTGAGLNLTLPNVIGEANIVAAIAQVWASPFSARAFAWRQALMKQPEHVYPAVLLLASVDNDKSGVLVTREIDTGSPDWLSVAVNEGVGGAVDGQSAESLRIHRASGEVRLLAQATTPLRRQLDPDGGIRMLPVSGRDAVLTPAEILVLREFARELPRRFPPLIDATGQPAPADVEFGFEGGRLRLFQIRPFLDDAAAGANAWLRGLDAVPADGGTPVDLEGVP